MVTGYLREVPVAELSGQLLRCATPTAGEESTVSSIVSSFPIFDNIVDEGVTMGIVSIVE